MSHSCHPKPACLKCTIDYTVAVLNRTVWAPNMPDLLHPGFECTVGYDSDVPCVIMTWRGYATSREFREANERILGVLSERGATKLLGDIKEFVLIGADDQHWLISNWIPRAMQVGLRTVALVTPVFYFNRVAIESV